MSKVEKNKTQKLIRRQNRKAKQALKSKINCNANMNTLDFGKMWYDLSYDEYKLRPELTKSFLQMYNEIHGSETSQLDKEKILLNWTEKLNEVHLYGHFNEINHFHQVYFNSGQWDRSYISLIWGYLNLPCFNNSIVTNNSYMHFDEGDGFVTENLADYFYLQYALKQINILTSITEYKRKNEANSSNLIGEINVKKTAYDIDGDIFIKIIKLSHKVFLNRKHKLKNRHKLDFFVYENLLNLLTKIIKDFLPEEIVKLYFEFKEYLISFGFGSDKFLIYTFAGIEDVYLNPNHREAWSVQAFLKSNSVISNNIRLAFIHKEIEKCLDLELSDIKKLCIKLKDSIQILFYYKEFNIYDYIQDPHFQKISTDAFIKELTQISNSAGQNHYHVILDNIKDYLFQIPYSISEKYWGKRLNIAHIVNVEIQETTLWLMVELENILNENIDQIDEFKDEPNLKHSLLKLISTGKSHILRRIEKLKIHEKQDELNEASDAKDKEDLEFIRKDLETKLAIKRNKPNFSSKNVIIESTHELYLKDMHDGEIRKKYQLLFTKIDKDVIDKFCEIKITKDHKKGFEAQCVVLVEHLLMIHIYEPFLKNACNGSIDEFKETSTRIGLKEDKRKGIGYFIYWLGVDKKDICKYCFINMNEIKFKKMLKLLIKINGIRNSEIAHFDNDKTNTKKNYPLIAEKVFNKIEELINIFQDHIKT